MRQSNAWPSSLSIRKVPLWKIGRNLGLPLLRNLPHMARGSLEGDMWRVLEGWLFPETKVVKKVWCLKPGGQVENKNVLIKLGFKPGKYWLLPHNPSASHSLECAWQLWTYFHNFSFLELQNFSQINSFFYLIVKRSSSCAPSAAQWPLPGSQV